MKYMRSSNQNIPVASDPSIALLDQFNESDLQLISDSPSQYVQISINYYFFEFKINFSELKIGV